MTTTLTQLEHEAMDVTAHLYRLIGRIVSQGPQRYNDLSEAALHLHALQSQIMGQAAARAYPERYRLLGEQGLSLTRAEVI